MTERTDLLASIATTIRDFREGEVEARTPEHVSRWVAQFDKKVQLPLLRELKHVLDQTYLSKDLVSKFFAYQINHPTLAGKDPKAFWQASSLLNIQQNGASQAKVVQAFQQALKSELGLEAAEGDLDRSTFIYMDDVLFTGNRIGNDLKPWIEKKGPQKCTVHVLVVASHALGQWQCFEGLKQTVAKTGKAISLVPWSARVMENRLKYRDASEVLWPAVLPNDARLGAYMKEQKKFPFTPRNVIASAKQAVFSSEVGRQLLEREFLLAGLKIRAGCTNPKPTMRPLGYSAFGLGFGSTIVTYQNCPNNCPLALWWGDPEATSGPFHWYPLLPRRTYAAASPFEFEALG